MVNPFSEIWILSWTNERTKHKILIDIKYSMCDLICDASYCISNPWSCSMSKKIIDVSAAFFINPLFHSIKFNPRRPFYTKFSSFSVFQLRFDRVQLLYHCCSYKHSNSWCHKLSHAWICNLNWHCSNVSSTLEVYLEKFKLHWIVFMRY